MESMRQEMNKHKADYSHLSDKGEDKRFILGSINNILAVFYKYRGFMGDSPAYCAAIITNPSLKLEFFQQKAPDFLDIARHSVGSLWEKEYIESAGNGAQSSFLSERGYPPSNLSGLSNFEQWITLPNSSPDPTESDSYRQYLSLPGISPTYCRNLLGWRKDDQFAEGQVTKLALDMLSIPAMSPECERTFSSA